MRKISVKQMSFQFLFECGKVLWWQTVPDVGVSELSPSSLHDSCSCCRRPETTYGTAMSLSQTARTHDYIRYALDRPAACSSTACRECAGA